MWRLFHYLFAWDYVLYDGDIRRIKKTPNGQEYIRGNASPMIFLPTAFTHYVTHLTRKP